MTKLSSRALITLVVGSAFLAFVPEGALACSGGQGCGGGMVLDWEQPYYKPGEIARGETPVTWPRRANRETGGPEDGPYDVYLRPARSKFRGRVSEDPQSTRVGIVQVRDSNRRGARALVEFVVPSVPGGDYMVWACNAECKLVLGDLLPSSITVVANEAEERQLLMSRLDGISRSVGRARALSVRTKVKLQRALRRADADVRAELAQLDYDVFKLTRRLNDVAKRPPDEGLGMGALVAVGALTGGGVSLGGLTLLRRRRLIGGPDVSKSNT